MTPSQARIDAALRLAEAADKYAKEFPLDVRNTGIELHRSLADYRATLPKLRSRAEVDYLIAGHCRANAGCWSSVALKVMQELCAEPTAPEPAPRGEQLR